MIEAVLASTVLAEDLDLPDCVTKLHRRVFISSRAKPHYLSVAELHFESDSNVILLTIQILHGHYLSVFERCKIP